ncbi:4-coumarate--CoA ligase 4, partial [Biomphalaria glabrata]
LAHIVVSKGLQRGDVVACSVPTSLELAVCYHGVILAGGVAFVTEATKEAPQQFTHFINTSRAKFLILCAKENDLTYTQHAHCLGEVTDDLGMSSFHDLGMPSVTTALCVERQGKVSQFLALLARYPSVYVDEELPETSIATLSTTSGTTGVPKLVMRTHRSYIEDADAGGFIPQWPGKKTFTISPFSWIAGSLLDILDGYTRVQVDMWTPPENLHKLNAEIITREPVRSAFLTPPEVQGLLEYFSDVDNKPFDAVVSAGFLLTRQICEMFLKISHQLTMRYGASEGASVSFKVHRSSENFQDFNCGQLIKGTRVKFVNEDGTEMAPGIPGKLMLQMPGLFSGYMGQEELNKKVLTSDGWFMNNDIGYLDKEGDLFVIGRYDNVIRKNGQMVYPSLIEKAIRQHPMVDSVIVVPISEEGNQPKICACVVGKAYSTLTRDEVIKMVELEAAKDGRVLTPPDLVLFLDSIPMNSRGKIKVSSVVQAVQAKLQL